MAWQQTPFTALLFVSSAVSGGVAAYAAANRETRGSVPLAILTAGAMVWTTGSGLQLASTDLASKVFWANVQYFGIVVVPAAWLAFALEYTGREQWLTRRTVALLAVEPIAALVLVWTNPAHGVFRASVALSSAGSFVVLDATPAVAFWFHAAYSYLLLVAGTVLILRVYLLSDDLYRSQAAALLVGVALPWGSNALFLAGLTPPGFYPTPLAFIATGLCLGWAVYRHELFAVVPGTREFAREELVASMTDAVITTDEDRRIVDLNPAAEVLVEPETEAAIGQPIGTVLPEITPAFEEDSGGRTDINLTRNGVTRHYDVRVSSIDRGYGTVSGYLVICRDVTEREQHRQRLEVLNRVLRHDLRNELNLLLGHADDLQHDSVDSEETAARIKEKGMEIASLSRRARQFEETLNRDEVVLERIEVVDLLERKLDAVREDYPAVEIETDCPDRAYAYASGLIDSAIDNLLKNAIEHNDRPDPVVRVSVTTPSDDTDLVEITIVDNGPGLPDEERAVLENGEESQLRHSSGLGLWLTNWIIVESGGEIRFSDNEPRGTTITISLLAAEERPPESTHS